MSDLRTARASVNWRVRQVLESRDIFDPADLDDVPFEMTAPGMLVSDALSLDEGGTTIACGGAAPRMPWEILL
jgi:hypothetical protein